MHIKYRWLTALLAMNVIVTGMSVNASNVEDVTVATNSVENIAVGKKPIKKVNNVYVASGTDFAELGVLDISTIDIDDRFETIHDSNYVDIVDDNTIFIKKPGASYFYWADVDDQRVNYCKFTGYYPTQVLKNTINVIDTESSSFAVTGTKPVREMYNAELKGSVDDVSLSFGNTTEAKPLKLWSKNPEYSTAIISNDRVIGYVKRINNPEITNVPSQLTLQKKGTFQLKPEIELTDAKFSYTTSNSEVAAVSKSGKVTAKTVGTAIVTISSGNYKKEITVDVNASALYMQAQEIDVYAGKPVTVKANKKATYSSSNNNVATVNSSGKITFVKEGTATITAHSGDQTATCTVNCKVPKVDIGYSELRLVKNSAFALNYEVDSSTDKVSFSSDNKNVVAVNSSGILTAKKPGIANITVKTAGAYSILPVIVHEFVPRYCPCYKELTDVSIIKQVDASEFTPSINYAQCNDCGRLITSYEPIEIDKEDSSNVNTHVHDYSKTETRPTCTSNGFTTYTCNCGHTYDVVSEEPLAEHNYGEAVTLVESSCLSGSVTTQTCVDCGHVKVNEESTLGEHQPIALDAIEATCDTEGKTAGKICGVCKKVLEEQKSIPKTEHVWVETLATMATCDGDGVTSEIYCSLCGETKQKAEIIECSKHNVNLNKNDGVCQDCGAFVAGLYDVKGRLIETWSKLTDGAAMHEDSWLVDIIANHPSRYDIHYLVLPEDMTEIHRNFLKGDKYVRIVRMPKGLQTIGDYAFADSNLHRLDLTDNIKSVGTHVASNSKSLTTAIVGDNITKLGNSWFESCSNLYSVTLPDNLTSIGLNCFKNAGFGFENFTIPESVTDFGYESFLNVVDVKAPCTLVDKLKEAGATKVIPIHADGMEGTCPNCTKETVHEITLTADNNYGVLSLGGSSGLVIPESWEYEGEKYVCTAVADGFISAAFSGGYPRVTLPLTCTHAGSDSIHEPFSNGGVLCIRNVNFTADANAFRTVNSLGGITLGVPEGLDYPVDYWGAKGVTPFSGESALY